ncbi:hypothetical protein [Streptomyces sp. TRM68367]|nr:hypothetical protein [Streptomyces sp. TRM68367]
MSTRRETFRRLWAGHDVRATAEAPSVSSTRSWARSTCATTSSNRPPSPA